MKSGKAIRHFYAGDKSRVVLRTPNWEDLDDFLGLINSLVEEKADILKTEKVSREEESFYLVAEFDGKVIAVSEITKRTGYERHVGLIGIAVRSSFRD